MFYLAQILEGLYTLMCVIFGVCLAAAFTFMLFGCMSAVEDGENTDSTKKYFHKMRIWGAASLIGVLGMIFVPKKQTYLFMVGGRVVDEAVMANPEIKELPSNTLNLLNEYIKIETEKVREKQTKE